MRLSILILAASWAGLWLTPDQQGQRAFRNKDYKAAAEAFQNIEWQGAAWYRAGEFEKAARCFGQVSSPEADFNAGNAWLMAGKYEQAIASYDNALEKKPGWKEAKENRDIAIARKKNVEAEGGDQGDQKIGADKIVFDKNKQNKDGKQTEVAGNKALSSAEIQALWLRQVQTEPADFLRSKFAYQQTYNKDQPE